MNQRPESPALVAVARHVGGLGELEAEILAYSAARLREGQEDFGPLTMDPSLDGFEVALKEVIDSTHYLTMELVRLMRTRDKRSRSNGLRKVYLCHPLASESRAAHHSLRQACREIVRGGCIPVCPQILFSVLLNEGLERDLALLVCTDLMRLCDEMRVYGAETTPDMQLEIKVANALSIPVRYMHPAAEVA
jgi:hypothetical protein